MNSDEFISAPVLGGQEEGGLHDRPPLPRLVRPTRPASGNASPEATITRWNMWMVYFVSRFPKIQENSVEILRNSNT